MNFNDLVWYRIMNNNLEISSRTIATIAIIAKSSSWQWCRDQFETILSLLRQFSFRHTSLWREESFSLVSIKAYDRL